MRARVADAEGFTEHDGVKIHYEVYGEGEPTLLLMPSWTIVHKRFWKGQIPYLSRHYRVVTYDGPGNGRSDRPLDPIAYGQEAQVAYALKVLDATGTDRAVLVALSKAANWALDLAANRSHRVQGTVLIGPTIAFADPGAARTAHSIDGQLPRLESSQVPLVQADPQEHWAKYNRDYWLEDYDDFVWFFIGQCFPEQRSTKQIEDAVSWGRETTGAVLVADSYGSRPDKETLAEWCGRIATPVLLIHGDEDRISPLRRSEMIAELTGGEW